MVFGYSLSLVLGYGYLQLFLKMAEQIGIAFEDLLLDLTNGLFFAHREDIYLKRGLIIKTGSPNNTT